MLLRVRLEARGFWRVGEHFNSGCLLQVFLDMSTVDTGIIIALHAIKSGGE